MPNQLGSKCGRTSDLAVQTRPQGRGPRPRPRPQATDPRPPGAAVSRTYVPGPAPGPGPGPGGPAVARAPPDAGSCPPPAGAEGGFPAPWPGPEPPGGSGPSPAPPSRLASLPMAGGRAGSGSHWARAGGSRAAAHTLRATTATAAAIISQPCSRRRLPLRMRGPGAPSLHTTPPHACARSRQPVRTLVHEPEAGSQGNSRRRQRMRRLRPTRTARALSGAQRRLVGASHLTRIGGTRITRRGCGGVAPCPALESVALSDSENLGVGALIWVT